MAETEPVLLRQKPGRKQEKEQSLYLIFDNGIDKEHDSLKCISEIKAFSNDTKLPCHIVKQNILFHGSMEKVGITEETKFDTCEVLRKRGSKEFYVQTKENGKNTKSIHRFKTMAKEVINKEVLPVIISLQNGELTAEEHILTTATTYQIPIICFKDNSTDVSVLWSTNKDQKSIVKYTTDITKPWQITTSRAGSDKSSDNIAYLTDIKIDVDTLICVLLLNVCFKEASSTEEHMKYYTASSKYLFEKGDLKTHKEKYLENIQKNVRSNHKTCSKIGDKFARHRDIAVDRLVGNNYECNGLLFVALLFNECFNEALQLVENGQVGIYYLFVGCDLLDEEVNNWKISTSEKEKLKLFKSAFTERAIDILNNIYEADKKKEHEAITKVKNEADKQRKDQTKTNTLNQKDKADEQSETVTNKQPEKVAYEQLEKKTDKQLEKGVYKQQETGADKQLEDGPENQLEEGAGIQLETWADKQLEEGADKQLEEEAGKQLDEWKAKQIDKGTEKQLEEGPCKQLEESADKQLEKGTDQQLDAEAYEQLEKGAYKQLEEVAVKQLDEGADKQLQGWTDKQLEERVGKQLEEGANKQLEVVANKSPAEGTDKGREDEANEKEEKKANEQRKDETNKQGEDDADGEREIHDNINHAERLLLNHGYLRHAIYTENNKFLKNETVKTIVNKKWYGTERMNFFTMFNLIVLAAIHLFVLPVLMITREGRPLSWLYKMYQLPFLKVVIHMLGFLVLLVAYAYMLLFDYSDDGLTNTDLFIVVWITSFLVDEIKQVIVALIRHKLKSYARNWWNILDWLFFIGYTSGMILRAGDGPGFKNTSQFFLVVSFMFLCMRILNLCCMTEFLGPKLVIIRKMIKQTIAFMIIMTVIMVWYSVSFYAFLYPNSAFSWTQIEKIISNGYWMLFGELNLESETLTPPYCTLNRTTYESDVLPRCPTQFGVYLTPYLKAFYGLIAVILLLNLLIAMYSDTFNIVQLKSETYWRKVQLDFLEEYCIKTVFPIHLQLLVLPGTILAIMFYCHSYDPKESSNKLRQFEQMVIRVFLCDVKYDTKLPLTCVAEEKSVQAVKGNKDLPDSNSILKEGNDEQSQESFTRYRHIGDMLRNMNEQLIDRQNTMEHMLLKKTTELMGRQNNIEQMLLEITTKLQTDTRREILQNAIEMGNKEIQQTDI